MKVKSYGYSIGLHGVMQIYVIGEDDVLYSVVDISDCDNLSDKELDKLALDVLADFGYKIKEDNKDA